MVMTIDTAEGFQAGCIGMAIAAGRPGTYMLARIDRKKLGVMRSIACRLPSGIGSMTVGAACRELGCNMVGVGGGVIIIDMAGNTFPRRFN